MVSPKHKDAIKSSWCFVDMKYVIILLLLLIGVGILAIEDQSLEYCLNQGFTLNECNVILEKESH